MTQDDELAKMDLYYLDEEAIAKEARFDCYYAVCTNLDADPLSIIAVKKGRWEIEACFRIMKNELKARPVYLKREDRILAHFLTCFVALLIYRILTKKIRLHLPDENPSGEMIVKTLASMNFLEKAVTITFHLYSNRHNRCLHDEFGFRTDLEFCLKRRCKKLSK